MGKSLKTTNIKIIVFNDKPSQTAYMQHNIHDVKEKLITVKLIKKNVLKQYIMQPAYKDSHQ